MARKTWTSTDPRWQALNKYQQAAAMSLMEADRMNPSDARNVLGAILNRSAKSGQDLSAHLDSPIYQPTIEPNQQARLDRILRSGEYSNLTSWAERRANGLEDDPVSGATHFLAPESTMLALEKSNPAKYKNWGPRGQNWTGYDPTKGEYKGVVMRDSSHAFLAPEGAYKPKATQVASVAPSIPNVLASGYGRESGPSAPITVAASPEVLPWASKPVMASAGASPTSDAKGGFAGLGKSIGGGIGAFAQAVGGSDEDAGAQQLAELAKVNGQMISEDEQRQRAALELMRSRRQKSAFA